MKITKTDIEGLLIIEPTIYKDDRGYFYESYNKKRFKENGLPFHFVQDNESASTYGVIRGLHYQLGQFAQTKLVRVIQGSVLDVAVDIRENSPTYGKHFSIELSAENKVQLLIPRGFAHGFSVLTENTIFSYKCDNFYNKEHEGSIIYNDATLDIDWKIPEDKVSLSPKDMDHPHFGHHRTTKKWDNE